MHQHRVCGTYETTTHIRRHMRGVVLALGIVLFALSARQCAAQVPAPSIPDNGPNPTSPLGMEPGATAAGTNESVNLMNGSVNLFIPLISFPQRGGYSMALGYVHHSNAITFQQATNVSSTVTGSGPGRIVIDELTYTDTALSYDPLLNINLPRLQFSYEYVGSVTVYVAGAQDHRDAFFCATNFVFTDWSGSKHPFENNTICNSEPDARNPHATLDVTDSSDGSFYQLNTTNSNDMQVVAKNGTVYHFTGYANLFPPSNPLGDPGPNSQANAWDSRASSIVDTNGNTIKIGTQYDSSGKPVYTVTDTIGRTVTIDSAGVLYHDSNGAPQQIALQITPSTNTTVNLDLSCFYYGPGQNPPYVTPTVNTVGTQYPAPQYTDATITFPTPSGGTGQRVYNLTFDSLQRISKVQYPTGGYSRYDYGGTLRWPYPTNVHCTGSQQQVAHKYECRSSSGSCASEDTTTYTPTVFDDGVNPVFNQSMVVQDPLNQQEKHLFATTNRVRTNPQETDIDTYSASGALVKTVHKAYPSISPPGSFQYSYDITFPSSITTSLNDVSPPVYSVTSITNAPYTPLLGYQTSVVIDNPTDITVSDYSTNTSGGAILRHISQQWEPASAFTPPHILDRLNTSTTTDPASGLSHTTTNGYDTVGNVTSVSEGGTNTATYTTQYPRNSYGQVTEIIDPKNNTTTIGYADAWSDGGACVPLDQSAYPTSITNALNQSTSYTYSSCTGTISTVTDPNGALTNYSYEAQDRVIAKTVKDSSNVLAASTAVIYADTAPAKITTQVAQDSAHSINTETDFDGLGRVVKSILLNDPQGAACIDTIYDSLGRTLFATNRHRGYSAPTDGTTGFTYDVLNRPLLQCNPDNGTLTTTGLSCLSGSAPATVSGSCSAGGSYRQWGPANQATDFYDEARHHSQQTVDGLGQLVVVKEPDSSNNPTLETDYTYALGNLTNVNQKGASSDTPRVRTFTYDGLSRLLTAKNPETGTVCYGQWSGSSCVNGYDGNGNLQYRTDARGVVTHYNYDALNRITSKSYPTVPAGIQTTDVEYLYDVPVGGWGWPAQTSPSYPTTQQTNLVGRLSQVGVNPAGTHAWTVYGYDAMGRTILKSECLPIDCGNNHHDIHFRYDLAGELTFYDRSYNVAANSASPNQGFYFGGFTQTYDGAGNLSSVTGDTAGANRATNILSGTDYFPNGQLYTATKLGIYSDKYSVNSRQWYTGEVITDAANVTVWQSSATRSNTGTVSTTTDSKVGNWSYTYDPLNRLQTAAGPTGHLSYTIDAFGNKSGQTVTSGTGPSPQGYQVAANNALTGNGLTYDAAGNVTYDGFHHYAYDVEGRLYQVDGTTCYIYDGDGDRVARTNCNVSGVGFGTITGVLAEFLYDTGGRLLAEVNAATQLMANGNIYAGGQLVAQDAPDANVTTATATQLRITDQVGSLRGLLDLGEHVVQSCTSFPYGDGATCSSPADQFFTGKERDTESGLDYFGARYYASSMGRFMSPDWDSSPVAIPYADRTNPQSFNLYSYVGNNPLSRTDPDGHCTNGGQQKGFFWCLFNDSDQDAAQARQNLAQYKNISINGKTPADAAKGLSNTQTVQLDRSVFDYISSQVMSSPGMVLALAIVPGAAEELIPAEAAAAADSGSLLNLNKSLASQEQMGQLAAGQGEAIAGAGTGTTLRDSQRLASQYGGDPGDWQKVASKNYNPGGAKGGGFETHAYQNVKTGQVVEMKTKFQ